jgi:transcriptional regulator with XRE-family HTH domain
MRTEAYDILPTPVRRSLKRLGRDIQVARKRRRLTIAMMTERVGVSKTTYMAVEKGDPRVGIGIYGTSLMVVGLGTPFADVADPLRDDEGLALDEARLPKRVRPRSGKTAL